MRDAPTPSEHARFGARVRGGPTRVAERSCVRIARGTTAALSLVVIAQRTTQPIRSEDLVPLLATSAGEERITARMAAVDLAGLVSETRTDLPVLAEVGDSLRAELARDDHALIWRRRLKVIAISFATTLGLALGYLIAS